MTKYFAFVDETRAGKYRLCMVRVIDSQITDFRELLANQRLKGQRRIHMKQESEARQWAIINALLSNTDWNAWIFESRTGSRITSDTRQELFLLAAQHNAWHQISHLVIEDSTERARDAKTLLWLQRYGLHSFSFRILRPQEEPGLWAADCIAWAYARGGQFRKEIKARVEVISGP